MYNLDDALKVGKLLNIKFDKFKEDDLLEGLNVELEHGRINQDTNVTNDSLILTAKIALAHLNEYPNYYNKDYGIKKFEEFLKQKNSQ
jgi:hypothetical protein